MKVVILLSGGLDSAVVLALAQAVGHEVFPLAVDYGQLHKQELLMAGRLAEFYRARATTVGAPRQARLRTVSVRFPVKLGSALTDPEVKLRPNGRREEAGPEVYVPGRNTFLLSLAAAYAEQVGAEEIHVGFTVRGFEDCRPDFVDAFNVLLAMGMRKPARVVAPLIRRTKIDVVKLAHKLRVPTEYTRSCLAGGEDPCGKCNSCFLRARAFKLLGLTDRAI